MKFLANDDFEIDRLGRGLDTGVEALQEEARVTLWLGSQKVISVMVGPSSTVESGFAFERLRTAVNVRKGQEYYLTQTVRRGMPDKFNINSYEADSYVFAATDRLASHLGSVSVAGTYDSTFSEPSASRNRGIGTVNFWIRKNHGCGKGLACADNNHTCVELPSLGQFELISGEGVCSVSDDGQCVWSKNYPNRYGNREDCSILAPEQPLHVISFSTERGYDKLTIDKTYYQGTTGPNGVSPTSALNWHTDGSSTRGGWKLCTEKGAASLIETDNVLLETLLQRDEEEEAAAAVQGPKGEFGGHHQH